MHAVPGIELAELAEWMRGRGVSVTEPLSASRIGQGQSNLIYLITDAMGQCWVLRRPPEGALLASAHDVAREARILEALDGRGVPVPGIVGLLETPEGTPMLVMDFTDGVVVDSVRAGEELSIPQRAALGASVPAALATIHAVDLEASGLSELASHKPYAGRQLRRWRAQWEDSRTRELPVVIELADRLAAAAPDQEELTLVHGDFHLRNLIAGPDGSVRAVLDWELCTLGDPIADLGSLMAYWPEAGEDALPEFAASALPGFPNRETIAAEYLSATGRSGEYVGFWHTLGLWKIAIIAEGIRRRALDRGQATSMTVAAIDAIVDRAARTATAAGI